MNGRGNCWLRGTPSASSWSGVTRQSVGRYSCTPSTSASQPRGRPAAHGHRPEIYLDFVKPIVLRFRGPMSACVYLGDLRHNFSGVLANDCMPLGVAYMKVVMDRDLPDVQTRLFAYPDRLLAALE